MKQKDALGHHFPPCTLPYCLKQTQWIVYQFYFDIFGMPDKHCELPMHIITNKHLDYFTQMASKKAVKTCQKEPMESA
ncbi:hypothetical protein T08_4841 [Trichinella sp. T8]|nr:hypothetical protein T08_4841 [Trichinella sp. T8]